MGAAFAVHEPVERPGWVEKILVLGVCGALLVALAVVDERAAERGTSRAHQAIADRAQRAAERSSREAMAAPVASAAARTEHLGRESPVVISGGAGLGPAASVVAEREVAEDTGTPAPQNFLRRTRGPNPSDATSVIPEPATPPLARGVQAPAPAAAAATAGARDDGPLLLMLMAALGLSMAGGGLRLISRRSA